jgi:hypothetical protein
VTLAREYAKAGHRRVRGWLDPLSARMILDLGEHQLEHGVRGAVGEIGVHRGRLFILLDLLRRPNERAFAIDVFSDQEANVDRSGRGDLDVFLDNVDRFSGGHDHLLVVQSSSADVEAPTIIDEVGPVRLMSIDGGHTSELTQNDLRLADEMLSPRGLVILDDAFNPEWPGVISGLTAYLADPHTRLVPVGFTASKTFLCHIEEVDAYSAVLRRPRSASFSKEAELMGHPVVGVLPFGRSAKGRMRQAYRWARRNPLIGPWVERLRASLDL